MFSWKHSSHCKPGLAKCGAGQSRLLYICWVSCLRLVCCSNAQELFAVSLFCMLTQLPERRLLSCGTVWTHSSSSLCCLWPGDRAFPAPLSAAYFNLYEFNKNEIEKNVRILTQERLYSWKIYLGKCQFPLLVQIKKVPNQHLLCEAYFRDFETNLLATKTDSITEPQVY